MKWLGLDIGEKRIGVAVSDEDEKFAFPLMVLERRSLALDVQAVLDLVLTHDVRGIVVGLPLELSGESGSAVHRTQRFVTALTQRFSGELILEDERFSTTTAERVLLEADTSRKRRKEVVDKLAASVILQQYLERKTT